MSKSERYQKGAAKMKELFGVEPRPGMMQADFQNITVEHLFGEIWARPGLTIRERSIITVATLTALLAIPITSTTTNSVRPRPHAVRHEQFPAVASRSASGR